MKYIKRIFCKHDYWWNYEFTLSNSSGWLDHECKEITIKCKKCGKRKTIKFKKSIDNLIQ